MNRIERVRAALAGQDVDRIPASFWFHFPEERARGDAAVAAHLDVLERTGVDFLKIMNEHPYEANATVDAPSDWRRMRPTPLSAGCFQRQLDEIKRIVDVVGGECLTVTTIRNPLQAYNRDTACRLVSEHLKLDPESVAVGLAAIAESLARFAEACVEAGADGVYFSAKGGDGRFTDEEFEAYVKPHDLTILDAMAGCADFNILHLCKDRIRFHLYTEYPSHAINWAVTKHQLSIADARTLFNRTVIGGMSDREVFVDGSLADVAAAARLALSEGGRTGFMLGADCTLPQDVDLARIRTAVETAHDVG